MTVELKGKVAAITGGARGIGKAIAEAFVAEGMSVAIGDLDLELAQATAKELGDRAVAFELDVTVPASMEAFVRSTEQAFGPLDVMVNNAGIMVVGDFLKEDDRATDLQIDVNVRGVLLGAKAAGRVMADRGQGHIVNIASAAGKVAIARLVTYAGTKHAVVGITDSLRAELRPHGIQVSAIMPNVVNTRLGAGLGSSMIPSVEPEDVAADVVRVVRGRRNDAMVPWILEPIRMLTAGLPSVARDFLTRALGGHDVMANTDDAVRDAYQAEALEGQQARR